MIRYLIFVTVMASIWGYLGHLQSGLGQFRNDLLGRTRFFIRQARGGDAQTRERLFTRYRLPDGDTARQREEFERLWTLLRACDPETVAYADAAAATGGTTVARRQVAFQAMEEKRRAVTVRLNWVQERDKWYIDGHVLEQSTLRSH
jgi:hypothetical protein